MYGLVVGGGGFGGFAQQSPGFGSATSIAFGAAAQQGGNAFGAAAQQGGGFGAAGAGEDRALAGVPGDQRGGDRRWRAYSEFCRELEYKFFQ